MNLIGKTAGALTLIAALAAPGAAEAKNYSVDGHVVAPPTASKGRLVVPILLTERAEHRMRLGKGLVRVSLPALTRLRSPAPTGRGIVAILPSTLRPGDHLKGSAPLSRKALKRLRKRAVPGFRVRRSRVARRASALSTDELTRIVGDLGRQLGLLTGRVNALANLTGTQIDGLLTRVESTTSRVDTLTNTIGTLESTLTQAITSLTLLEGAVPNAAELLKLQGDITSLLGRTGSLETVTTGLSTSVGSLTGTVTGLQQSFTSLGGQVTTLTGTVSDLGSRLTTSEAALAQLPALISQVTTLDGSLVALTGRVATAEGSLTTLGTSLTTLTGTVNGISADVAALCGSPLLLGLCL